MIIRKILIIMSAKTNTKTVRKAKQKNNNANKPQKGQSKEEKVKVPTHSIMICLSTNKRDDHILSKKYEAGGKLVNATLSTLLKRVDQMRRDKRWAAARLLPDNTPEKTTAYRVLHQEYAVSMFHARDIAFKHWQASNWMPQIIGSNLALSIGAQVWTPVAAYLYSGAGRPKFKPSKENNVLHGNGNKQNLHLKLIRGKAYVRVSGARKACNLLIKLPKEWQPGTLKWERHLAGRDIKRLSLKREVIRGKVRQSVMISVTGTPYRNPDYVEAARTHEGKTLGLDIGPSLLAVVGEDESLLISLYPIEAEEARRKEAEKRRRQQRYQARSRRAMNPKAFDKKGRSIKGVRQSKKSKKYERVSKQLTELERRRRIHKREDRAALAHTLMSQIGTRVSSEINNYSAWQASRYGKRMCETAPASIMNHIHKEAVIINNHLNPIIPSSNNMSTTSGVSSINPFSPSYEFKTSAECAPSQHCLCGSKVKKELSNRYHACDDCGLGKPVIGALTREEAEQARLLGRTDNQLVDYRLDRDLFSALLARLISENQDVPGNTRLDDGPYSAYASELSEDGNRTRVLALTSARTPVVTPSLTIKPEGVHELVILEQAPVDGSIKLGITPVVTETINQTQREHLRPRETYEKQPVLHKSHRVSTLLQAINTTRSAPDHKPDA